MNILASINTTPDFEAIKQKQNAAWSSGDYSKIGTTLQITGEMLAEAAAPVPGASVLDIAAGNGNATLAFARRFCDVTSTDYVPALLKAAHARAMAEGLDIRFQEADAENLPFADGSFDLAVSTFGIMFTPNQEKAASEMQRVVRSGGKIAMANWTPESFIGGLFKAIGKNVPPPAGLMPPSRWGTAEWLEKTFGANAADISIEMLDFNFRYKSPAHFLDLFRTFYGPTHKAFLALDEAGQKKLEADILETVAAFDKAADGTMDVPSQYAQIVITKK